MIVNETYINQRSNEVEISIISYRANSDNKNTHAILSFRRSEMKNVKQIKQVK